MLQYYLRLNDQSESMRPKECISGEWLFDKQTTQIDQVFEEIIALQSYLVVSLAARHDDSQWHVMAILKYAKTSGAASDTFHELVHTIDARLKRRFNEAYRGRSVSAPTWFPETSAERAQLVK